jgi:anthranilate/para-aminobenzoate synthase component II
VHASLPTHGKSSAVLHDGRTIYRGLPNPIEAGRYHSLVVETDDMNKALIVTARTADGVIMGVRHPRYCVEGVQFHPESIMTAAGHELLRNFLGYRGGYWPAQEPV